MDKHHTEKQQVQEEKREKTVTFYVNEAVYQDRSALLYESEVKEEQEEAEADV